MGEMRRRDLSLTEVYDKQASGEVAETYDRIKQALQANVVNFVWRVFATKPQFLEAAWNELEPAVDKGLLEAADGIRALAIEKVREAAPIPDHRPLLEDDLHKATEELRLFLEVNPRLLILVCALRHSWNRGEVGGMRDAIEADRSIPQWHPQVETESSPSGAAKDALGEMVEVLDLPAPNTDYMVLAKWPDYFTKAWTDLRGFVGTEAWHAIGETVDWVSEHAAMSLPTKIHITPDLAKEIGLSDDETKEIGVWIEAFHGLLPWLIVNTSYFWVGINGGVRPLHLAQDAGTPPGEAPDRRAG
jgi:hypothetical protein